MIFASRDRLFNLMAAISTGKFPNEILLRIFRHCDLADVIRLREVGHTCRTLAEEVAGMHFRGREQRARNLVVHPCRFIHHRYPYLYTYSMAPYLSIFIKKIIISGSRDLWEYYVQSPGPYCRSWTKLLVKYGSYEFITWAARKTVCSSYVIHLIISLYRDRGRINPGAVKWASERWPADILLRNKEIGTVPGFISRLIRKLTPCNVRIWECENEGYGVFLSAKREEMRFYIYHISDFMAILRHATQLHTIVSLSGPFRLELLHHMKKSPWWTTPNID